MSEMSESEQRAFKLAERLEKHIIDGGFTLAAVGWIAQEMESHARKAQWGLWASLLKRVESIHGKLDDDTWKQMSTKQVLERILNQEYAGIASPSAPLEYDYYARKPFQK